MAKPEYSREALGVCTRWTDAARPVCSNTAEGFGRRSRREFARVLELAYSSRREIEGLVLEAHMCGIPRIAGRAAQEVACVRWCALRLIVGRFNRTCPCRHTYRGAWPGWPCSSSRSALQCRCPWHRPVTIWDSRAVSTSFAGSGAARASAHRSGRWMPSGRWRRRTGRIWNRCSTWPGFRRSAARFSRP
ncbi:MAG: four helix bundle protein [Acidobacteria bacterium]|nr:four helix bundle protein [Acidobacteriota bacterium]